MAKKQAKKIRLKRAKEDKALKSKLKQEIAQFLVDMEFCISANQEGSLIDVLRNGHRGYFNMRNKDLVGELETAYEILNRSPKHRITFYSYPEGPHKNYGFVYKDMDDRYGKKQEEVHETFKSRAEGLVGQVLDAIIGLEREEAAGGPPSAKAYKRGLPDADINEPWCDF